MSGVPTVHVVLPAGVDDPARPTGGNVYDRRLCAGLPSAGWAVREHLVPGGWPAPAEPERVRLADSVAAVPDGALVLIDGLIASAAADVLVPATARLRLVVLVHMPLGLTVESARAGEHAVLSNAAAVVATSAWTRDRLLEQYRLDPARMHVAVPGVDPAQPATGTASGGELLCVAALAPHKGQDVLVAALGGLTDRTWRCRLVGALDRDPEFVASLRSAAVRAGVDGRLDIVGPLVGGALDDAYAAADLFVLPSRGETYGMVIAEALAHGLPVVVSDVGGVREAVGDTGAGLLVPPGDPVALTAALRSWLTDADARPRLRRAAGERRTELPGWSATVEQVATALAAAAAPVR